MKYYEDENKVNPEAPPAYPHLTDSSPMPFGKHKGELMEDVPVEYLHWFYTEVDEPKGAACAVLLYIEKNIVALKRENADLIWERPS